MSIPTDNLRAQIAGFEERARTWLRSQSKDVDNLASMHDASVQESNAEIFRLKTECQALKDEEERQRELEKDLEAELASLNRDYDAILATKAAKPAERAMLKEKIIELDNLNTQKLLELNDDKRVSTQTLSSLTSIIHTYASALGMHIELSNGMLRFLFTDVHPLAPSATLSFLLHTDDSKQYRVFECVPPLRELDAIVAELRATEDVAFFVHRMRRAFREKLDAECQGL